MRDDRLITIKGFLNEFVGQHYQRPDRPFCFVLGAGASRPSGIPTGQELARQWLNELHEAEDLDGLPLEQWATAERLAIEAFDCTRAHEFYPDLYTRRFGDREQAGYAFLESQMEGKEPSFGYSVLAHLLSTTPHKIVITTNFDNLVADALCIYTERFPIVVGHDALAPYVRADIRRPLIAKVHGGLGFSPKSKAEDLAELSKGWRDALKHVFDRYTPIVIGYEGNDGSLMTFLESLPDGTPDAIFWCLYTPDGDTQGCLRKLDKRVKTLVERKKGRFVPIPGFDALMQLLLTHLAQRGQREVPDLYAQLQERARKREAAFDQQMQKTQELIKSTLLARPKVPIAASEPKGDQDATLLAKASDDIARSRKDKPWWAWAAEVETATDADRKEAIYQEGLAALPESSELRGNYANFLWYTRQDIKAAEEHYVRAINAAPKHATNLGNYALFLQTVRKDADAAETFFKRAIDADPKNANNLGLYALFLQTNRKDADAAETFFKRATDADPKNANNLWLYALFLQNVRKDKDATETLFKRAIDADPENANLLGSYALFLQNVRKDKDAAETFFKRAIDADPGNANLLGDYASFLKNAGNNMDAAETFFKRAIDADPTHANNLGLYALFLQKVRNEMDAAEMFFKRAIDADPKNAETLGNYALFLQNVRKDKDAAETLFRRTLDADPKHANNMANYAQFLFLNGKSQSALAVLEDAEMNLRRRSNSTAVELSFYRVAHVSGSYPGELGRTRRLIEEGRRSPGWLLDRNVALARTSGHPNAELLATLAQVISAGMDPGELNRFPEWRDAVELPSEKRTEAN